MTEELNPIPSGSVITEDMITAWQDKYPDEGRDAIIGTLRGFEAGEGELPSDVFDSRDTRTIFQPLRRAYFAAKKIEEPPYSEDAPLS